MSHPPLRAQNYSLQYLKEFDNHLMVVAFEDSASSLRGYIAIHNTQLGPALGGTRLKEYPDQETALRDVLNLSKAMSYKCAMAGLPFGGGKGVVMKTPSHDEKAALKRYAEVVNELRGLFKTGTDVGITDADVAYMAQHTKHMLGVVPGDRGDMSTSSIAALGVYHSIRASLQYAYGSANPDGVAVAIKGVGKLGGELARLLHRDGAKITIADVDEKKCEELLRDLPGIVLSKPDIIHGIPTQVYAPCALGNEFTARSVEELKAEMVVGGANNQLADESVGDMLHDRGILYAPDYIVNSGGLIYVADELEADGFQQKRVLERAEAIGQTLTEVYTHATERNQPTNRVADAIARERIGLSEHE